MILLCSPSSFQHEDCHLIIFPVISSVQKKRSREEIRKYKKQQRAQIRKAIKEREELEKQPEVEGNPEKIRKLKKDVDFLSSRPLVRMNLGTPIPMFVDKINIDNTYSTFASFKHFVTTTLTHILGCDTKGFIVIWGMNRDGIDLFRYRKFVTEKRQIEQATTTQQHHAEILSSLPKKHAVLASHFITLLQTHSFPFCTQSWLSFDKACHLLKVTDNALSPIIKKLVSKKFITHDASSHPFIAPTEAFWGEATTQPLISNESLLSHQRLITEMTLLHLSFINTEQLLTHKNNAVLRSTTFDLPRYYQHLSQQIHLANMTLLQ
ncbi:hypothetical protein ACNO5M_10275 [Vibrio owensii]|uniref:hypothetical protein n=1 Tax=Vibrio owensii TaxID=696485 RepID=UPI003AAE1870